MVLPGKFATSFVRSHCCLGANSQVTNGLNEVIWKGLFIQRILHVDVVMILDSDRIAGSEVLMPEDEAQRVIKPDFMEGTGIRTP